MRMPAFARSIRRRRSAAPGVLAVLTGRDLRADGLQADAAFGRHAAPGRHHAREQGRLAALHPAAFRDDGRRRRAIAARSSPMVVGDDLAAAKDAAELVAVDYEPLPAVSHSVAAVEPGAPLARGTPAPISPRRRGRRRGGDRRRLCRGGPHRPVRDLGAAHRRGADGAARRHRRPTTRRPGATRSTPGSAARSARSRTSPCPRRRRGARCASSCTMSAAISARAARSIRNSRWSTWAARRVGRPVKWTCERQEAFRLRLPGARPRGRGRARARRATADFLAMRGSNIANSRRLPDLLRAARQGRRDHVEHLPRAGSAFPRPRRDDQHVADPPLSQLGTARSHVRHGAADRPRGAAMRLRPASSCGGAISCRNRRCRTATRSAWSTTAAPTTRSWSGCSRSATGPAFRRAAPRRAARGKCRGIGVANYVDTATGAPRERAEVTVKPDGIGGSRSWSAPCRTARVTRPASRS